MGLLSTARVALQLSGGGARAAYQIGVLQTVAKHMPEQRHSPFQILSGTSAGAINATTLACYASNFQLGVNRLSLVWRHFRTEQIYRCDALGLIAHLLGNMRPRKQRAGSLFNNEPLRQLLAKVIPLQRIDKQIEGGYLHAVTVSASRYYHPCSVNFFQGHPAIKPWQRSHRFGQHAQLTVEHLLASAAIPMVFPSIRLGDDHYGDGSVLQMAPLSPAVHLGADKILVVNLDSPHRTQPLRERRRAPKGSELAGHLLDTIFSDTLNADMERLERINRTLALVPEKQRLQQPLKPIDTLVIKPSEDLDEIARSHYHKLPRGIRGLLKAIGVNQESDSSLLSYLMFEGPYCQELIELGRQDAEKRLEPLMALCCD